MIPINKALEQQGPLSQGVKLAESNTIIVTLLEIQLLFEAPT